jgi:hypothetical protein
MGEATRDEVRGDQSAILEEVGSDAIEAKD